MRDTTTKKGARWKMKISQLIRQLEKVKEKYGNIEICHVQNNILRIPEVKPGWESWKLRDVEDIGECGYQ